MPIPSPDNNFNAASADDPAPGRKPRSLVVKFRDSIAIDYEDGLEKRLQEKIDAWKDFVQQFPDCTFKRIYSKTGEEKLRAAIDRATKWSSHYRRPEFLKYFVLDCSEKTELDSVLKALGAIDMVEFAYVSAMASDPWSPQFSNPGIGGQFHLNPAPWGIDAKVAWNSDGNGAGQEVVDVEQGWTLDHEELVHLGIQRPIFGASMPASQSHGTAVLGVICGADNDTGGVGITPQLAPGSVNVVSWSGVEANIPQAIVEAMMALSPGGVLVLEVQVRGMIQVQGAMVERWLPCEIDLLVRENIRLATSAGVVVVEAAGNGGSNLDEYKDAFGSKAGKKVFRRPQSQANNADFDDSGAIMVGSADLGIIPQTGLPSWPRRANSNYGSRVDCFAAGERIGVVSSNADPRKDYADLTSTSGATAIIAGAGLAVQGMATKLKGRRLTPNELCDLLRKHGTPSNSVPDRIGVMPDLKLILQRLIAPV